MGYRGEGKDRSLDTYQVLDTRLDANDKKKKGYSSYHKKAHNLKDTHTSNTSNSRRE